MRSSAHPEDSVTALERRQYWLELRYGFSGGTHLGTAFQTEGAAQSEAVHVQAAWGLLYCGVAMADAMGQMGVGR